MNSVRLLPSGKILIGGNFTSYNTSTANRIARLNNDGTYDAAFSSGSGFNAPVSVIIPAANPANLLVAGTFTSYNAIAKNRIVRLVSCSGSGSSTTDLAICASELPYTWNGNSYPAAGTYTVSLPGAGGCDSLATLNLSIGASAINGPARACAFIQPASAMAEYTITAVAGATITWSVSKPLTMLIINGQGTNHINVQYT